MKKTKVNYSLKEALGVAYYDYVNELIIPKIEELYNSGEISKLEKNNIEFQIISKDKDLFNINLKYLDEKSLEMNEGEGWIAVAEHEPVENMKINHVIKKSLSKENYKAGTEALSSLFYRK